MLFRSAPPFEIYESGSADQVMMIPPQLRKFRTASAATKAGVKFSIRLLICSVAAFGCFRPEDANQLSFVSCPKNAPQQIFIRLCE